MKLVKRIHTNSIYLSDLINILNRHEHINASRNREIIVNDLIELVLNNIRSSLYDIPIELNIANVYEHINCNDLSVVIPFDMVGDIVDVLHRIERELLEIVVLEAILPDTIFYTTYMLNEFITINVYDIHPIKRIS